MKKDLDSIRNSILNYINRKDSKNKGLFKRILEIVDKNKEDILELNEILDEVPEISVKTFAWVMRKIKEVDDILFFLNRFEDGCELAILLSRIKGTEDIKEAITKGKGKLGELFKRRSLVLRDLIGKLLLYREFYDSEETKEIMESIRRVLESIKSKSKWYDEKKFKEGSKHVRELKRLIEFMEDLKEVEDFLESLLKFLKEYYKARKAFHKRVRGVVKKGRLLNKLKKVEKKDISIETEAVVLGRIRRYKMKIILNLRKFKKFLKKQLGDIKKIKIKDKRLKEKFEDVFTVKESLEKFLQRTITYLSRMSIEEKEIGEEGKEEEAPIEEISKDIIEIIMDVYIISEEIKRVFSSKKMKSLLKAGLKRRDVFEALNKIIEKDKERIEEINKKIGGILEKIKKMRGFLEKSIKEEEIKRVKDDIRHLKKEIKKEKKGILSEKKAYYKIYKKSFLKGLKRILKLKIDTGEDYKKLKGEKEEIEEISKYYENMIKKLEKKLIKEKGKFLKEIEDILKDVLDFLDSLREMLEDMIETEDIETGYGEKLFSGFLEYILSYEEALRTGFKKVLGKISKLIKIKEDSIGDILEDYLRGIETMEIKAPEVKRSPDAYKIMAKASEGITKILEKETKKAENLTNLILKILIDSKILGKEIRENKEMVKKTIKNLSVLSKIIKKLFKVRERKKRKIRLPKISLPLFR